MLTNIKRWMSFYGWSDGGNPGSTKLDADGNTVAHHGDATWIGDVQRAIEADERERIVAELERRDATPAAL